MKHAGVSSTDQGGGKQSCLSSFDYFSNFPRMLVGPFIHLTKRAVVATFGVWDSHGGSYIIAYFVGLLVTFCVFQRFLFGLSADDSINKAEVWLLNKKAFIACPLTLLGSSAVDPITNDARSAHLQ
jgi:hypothetical protein